MMCPDLYNIFVDLSSNNISDSYSTVTISTRDCTTNPHKRISKEQKIKRQEPPKVCRTKIEESVDPYWKGLERKWGIR